MTDPPALPSDPPALPPDPAAHPAGPPADAPAGAKPPRGAKAPTSDAQFAVQLTGITKRFPGVVANSDINISVRRGTVHALVGENGAGKSTLMKTLYGMHQPDEGTITVNGVQATFHSPSMPPNRRIPSKPSNTTGACSPSARMRVPGSTAGTGRRRRSWLA